MVVGSSSSLLARRTAVHKCITPAAHAAAILLDKAAFIDRSLANNSLDVTSPLFLLPPRRYNATAQHNKRRWRNSVSTVSGSSVGMLAVYCYWRPPVLGACAAEECMMVVGTRLHQSCGCSVVHLSSHFGYRPTEGGETCVWSIIPVLFPYP